MNKNHLQLVLKDSFNATALDNWFNELVDLGERLSSLKYQNFFFAISLPTLELSASAIAIGLVKGELEKEVEKTHVDDVRLIEENTRIAYWDGKKLVNAIFVCIEKNYYEGEDYIRIRNENIDDFIKVNNERTKKILFINNNQETEEKFKKIKNYEPGLGEIFLNSEESLRLRTNTESKILFIANKNSFEEEICKQCVKDEKSKQLFKFNDILRVEEFLGKGQSIFTSIASFQSKNIEHLNKDFLNYKFYIGSNAFLKKQKSYSKIKNSIVLLSPHENQYEDAILQINKRYGEREFKSDFPQDKLKEMNLNYLSILFREK